MKCKHMMRAAEDFVARSLLRHSLSPRGHHLHASQHSQSPSISPAAHARFFPVPPLTVQQMCRQGKHAAESALPVIPLVQVIIDGKSSFPPVGRGISHSCNRYVGSSLIGRPNLIASLHSLSATSDVLA